MGWVRSSLEDVQWTGQRNTNEGPVVVCLRRVHLLTVIFAQVSLCQALVHLVEDGALGALLRAHKSDHEAPLDAEAQDSLDVRTNHFEVHETDDAVLEEVRGDLIDVLSLVLELLLERDKFAAFSLPCWSVIDKRLCENANLAAGLDDIVELRSVRNRVVYLVVFAVFYARTSQIRHDGKWHALLLGLSQSLYSFFCHEVLRLKEKLIVRISLQLFLVLRINLTCHLSLVLEELSVLFLPTLKFFHLLLVVIFFFDDSTLLLLLSCSKCFSLLSQFSFS